MEKENKKEIGDVVVAREAGEDEFESDRFNIYHPIGTVYKKVSYKPKHQHSTLLYGLWKVQMSGL